MGFKVDKVNWRANALDIKTVREKVFVYEYRVPAHSEFDNNDDNCDHVLIRDEDGRPIATGRLCSDGKISRVAVVKKHRKTEVSQKVIKKLIAIAKTKGMTCVSIDSELADVSRYRASGFTEVGSVYMEAGIAKQTLTCPVESFSCYNNILH